MTYVDLPQIECQGHVQLLLKERMIQIFPIVEVRNYIYEDHIMPIIYTKITYICLHIKGQKNLPITSTNQVLVVLSYHFSKQSLYLMNLLQHRCLLINLYLTWDDRCSMQEKKKKIIYFAYLVPQL